MQACVLHRVRDLRIEYREDSSLREGEVRFRLGRGSLCGSDLHYYFEGRVGEFRVREPLILGHEVCGDVIEVAADVDRVRVGQRVKVNPRVSLSPV